MKAVWLAPALLLSGCAMSMGRADQYLLLSESYHGLMVWSRFDSLAACQKGRARMEAASRPTSLRMPVRCMSAGGVRRSWVIVDTTGT